MVGCDRSADGGPTREEQAVDDGLAVGAHDRGYLKDVVQQPVRGLPPEALVFADWDLAGLERIFRSFSASEGIKLTPHELRHTGPSHDFYYHKVSVAELQWRGRWMAVESCRRYSKPAKMLRGLAAMTRDQVLLAERASHEVPKLVLKGLTELRSAGRFGMSCQRRGRGNHAARSSERAAQRE